MGSRKVKTKIYSGKAFKSSKFLHGITGKSYGGASKSQYKRTKKR